MFSSSLLDSSRVFKQATIPKPQNQAQIEEQQPASAQGSSQSFSFPYHLEKKEEITSSDSPRGVSLEMIAELEIGRCRLRWKVFLFF
jgi:hypothetical protein